MKNRYIKMDPNDNVIVLLEALHQGDEIEVDGELFRAQEEIPVGHKMAIRSMSEGEYVVKYGERIGRLTAPVPAGGLVHVHNVYDTTEEVYQEERAKLGL